MITAEWFAENRGISAETLDAFGVRFENNSVIFPYTTGEKIRSFDLEGKRSFRFTPGHKPSLYQSKTLRGSTAAFLCEGETDTMRLWQEMAKEPNPSDVFGLAGLNTWQDAFASILDNYEVVYVVLDNEEPYDNPVAAQQVEDVWLKIRKALGMKARRLRLPPGVKDVCEFFSVDYDMDSLRLLVKRGRSISRFTPLDLNKEPPPVNWLLEGLIAKGDVTLLSGVSNLGKSWITMGLSVAVADGHETFLGCNIHHSGKVLGIDEENPEDVVYSRFHKLGLRNTGNLRYIWNNGIRIDRKGNVVLEEALDFEPELIILDSLTRIHSGEENNVGDMAPLLNDCIKPLARETGAAVVLIHHHDKSANGPRGSSDIINSVDGALDAYATGVPGQLAIKLTKSRRRLTGQDVKVKITDMPDGSVRLVPLEALEPPF